MDRIIPLAGLIALQPLTAHAQKGTLTSAAAVAQVSAVVVPSAEVASGGLWALAPARATEVAPAPNGRRSFRVSFGTPVLVTVRGVPLGGEGGTVRVPLSCALHAEEGAPHPAPFACDVGIEITPEAGRTTEQWVFVDSARAADPMTVILAVSSNP
ncbi:MAG TPA: hypothetical protein VD962_12595 [Rubricoccaceae bacterium]|nr:hypothetical protein [Rubricoccaceae bacterium]